MSRISGKDIRVLIGALYINVDSLSATITDNRKAVTNGGVPNGHVNGDVSCAGDIEVDTKNFMIIMEAARIAGSFRELDTFDINTVAQVGNEFLGVEMFECLFAISDLINVDPNGSEKTKHKIRFEVTGPDFVRINGVDYLGSSDTFGF